MKTDAKSDGGQAALHRTALTGIPFPPSESGKARTCMHTKERHALQKGN
jgi:hypothetical protein